MVYPILNERCINSRKLDDLLPHITAAAEKLLAQCEAVGIKLLVTSTYRNYAEQERLYAQGRTTPGKVVTKARPGYSAHNFRRAFDVVPLKDGKAWWDAPFATWAKIGVIGESLGLEWGGRWKGFVDLPHFQDLDGQTLADYRRKSQETIA